MSEKIEKQFPDGFIIGAGSAAYQVEGAWNEDGKGESMWDRLVHSNAEVVKDRSNGDIACDSYHRYTEDIKLLKDIGFQMYRFSLSWTRILPNGDMSVINQQGIDYYHRLIDELLDNGIQPMVTIYHWDLPQNLQDFGGWLNPILIDYFVDFARLAFQLYGDKVKWWITINEPYEIVTGYGIKRHAPYLRLESYGGDYLAGHILLKAHAKAYHVYDTEFRPQQKGKLSFTINGHYCSPKNDTLEDQEAAERANQFTYGWFAHPIYSKDGDYPKIMREYVDENSRKEGRTSSRLPTFTQKEIEEIRGTFDFLSFNYYTSYRGTNGMDMKARIVFQDANVIAEPNKAWPRSPTVPWLRVVPPDLRNVLLWLKKEYDNPTVFITENGYGDAGELNDIDRIKYFESYMSEMLNAIHNHGCNVIGYIVWTFLDNFEWLNGYTCKFGVVHVDFEDPKRKRKLKKSANFFREILVRRCIPQIESYWNS